MKLGSGMYKEIARDALKGNWMKAIAAGFAAGWLGVFSSSFLFIAGYVLLVESALCKDYIVFCSVTGICFADCARNYHKIFLCDGAIYS